MENRRPEVSHSTRPANRSFNLAGFDEMWRQLEDLHESGSVQEQFLEVILEKADTEVTGASLVRSLIQDMEEFVQANQLPEVVSKLMLSRLPDYLTVLIPDPEIREDSLRLWDEIIEGVKHEDSLREPTPAKMPRKLKKAIRKPAHARTSAEQARVQAFLGRRASRR